MIKNMDMEYKPGKVVTFTKETILKMKEMVMDKCFGQMEAIIKEIGSMESNMELDK